MKKEIPILYSTAMAQAKVAWRKTQTRRMSGLEKINECPDDWTYTGYQEGSVDHGTKRRNGYRTTGYIFHNSNKAGFIIIPSSYGQPGDLLWGRETFQEYGGKYYYKADGEEINGGPLGCANKWTPSLHMPKAAARIWDENTGIRAERVADISEEDCIAEGIEISKHSRTGGTIYKCYDGQNDFEYSPKESYKSLWQLINGKPKAIQERQNGKLVTIGYEVYPFDEYAAAEFAGLTTWKKKPLSVITNPWVWVIESKQLSVNGKP